jgi:hypothetical protein
MSGPARPLSKCVCSLGSLDLRPEDIGVTVLAEHGGRTGGVVRPDLPGRHVGKIVGRCRRKIRSEPDPDRKAGGPRTAWRGRWRMEPDNRGKDQLAL